MPTVLVVDDNSELRGLLRSFLARRGYDVIAAGGPSQALAAAETHPGAIDVALLDVILPEMRCGDCAARLRRSHPGVRMIYMSGYPREIAWERGNLDDDGLFVMKPFTPATLLSAIRMVLEQPPALVA